MGQLAAGLLSLRRHPLADHAGATFGIGLMIWIFAQVSMIGSGHMLQYSYFALGVIETVLAFLILDSTCTEQYNRKTKKNNRCDLKIHPIQKANRWQFFSLI